MRGDVGECVSAYSSRGYAALEVVLESQPVHSCDD